MSDDPARPPDQREMYTGIAGLVGAIAKALTLPESEVAAAMERGAMTLEFATDGNGNRFVAVGFEGRTARVYQGAIRRDPAGGKAT